MPSNGGPAGCWRKIDEAFHRPIMDLENTRSPARTARQTKPSKSIQARRLAYTSRPQKTLLVTYRETSWRSVL
jgi:hypothetical protein